MPLPVGARPGWPACVPHPSPSRSTFHGGGNRIHGFFLLHPGLCSVRGLLREGGQNRRRTGGGTLGPSLSPADPGERRPGLAPRTGSVCAQTLGLSVTQDSAPNGGRPWAPAWGHMETLWPDCPGPHKHLCQCETRTRSLDPGPIPWETPNVGGRGEKTGPGNSPNFRPPLHQL